MAEIAAQGTEQGTILLTVTSDAGQRGQAELSADQAEDLKAQLETALLAVLCDTPASWRPRCLPTDRRGAARAASKREPRQTPFVPGQEFGRKHIGVVNPIEFCQMTRTAAVTANTNRSRQSGSPAMISPIGTWTEQARSIERAFNWPPTHFCQTG
jgi:hypothetical protein